MDREEIKNKIFEWFKQRVILAQNSESHRQLGQLQMANIYEVFPPSEPSWKHEEVYSVVREITQELITMGFLYPGTASDFNSGYPWITITEYGKEAFLKEDWLPYDPEGYIKALQEKVPSIDEITLAYIGEAISNYNRRHLLSATITLGVASENIMLLLIEAYTNWVIKAKKNLNFEKKVKGRFISIQYREFKKEFMNNIKLLPKEFQSDWETYLDGVFNFIRLNRNDAGHPTGKRLDVKVVNANLQIFAEYAQFIFSLIEHFNWITNKNK